MRRTLHFNYPLFDASDKPSWLTDWNETVTKIDEKLFQIATASGETSTLQQEIDALRDKLDAVIASIAPTFDASATYHTNDMVYHSDKLYIFIADYVADSGWESATVTEKSVASVLFDLLSVPEPEGAKDMSTLNGENARYTELNIPVRFRLPNGQYNVNDDVVSITGRRLCVFDIDIMDAIARQPSLAGKPCKVVSVISKENTLGNYYLICTDESGDPNPFNTLFGVTNIEAYYEYAKTQDPQAVQTLRFMPYVKGGYYPYEQEYHNLANVWFNNYWNSVSLDRHIPVEEMVRDWLVLDRYVEYQKSGMMEYKFEIPLPAYGYLSSGFLFDVQNHGIITDATDPRTSGTVADEAKLAHTLKAFGSDQISFDTLYDNLITTYDNEVGLHDNPYINDYSIPTGYTVQVGIVYQDV